MLSRSIISKFRFVSPKLIPKKFSVIQLTSAVFHEQRLNFTPVGIRSFSTKSNEQKETEDPTNRSENQQENLIEDEIAEIEKLKSQVKKLNEDLSQLRIDMEKDFQNLEVIILILFMISYFK